MPRIFSVVRRKPDLIDITIRPQSGLEGYVFGVASNFDGVFADFQTISINGYKSKSVPDVGPGFGFRGLTRFLFAPSDYTAAFPALDGTLPLWLTVKEVPLGGVPGPASAPHLILPFSAVPNRAFNIHGTVDGSSTELVLPQTVSNADFLVQSGDDLYVAYDPGGTEFRVPLLSTYGLTISATVPSFESLFVRSNGVSSEFYAALRLLNSLAL